MSSTKTQSGTRRRVLLAAGLAGLAGLLGVVSAAHAADETVALKNALYGAGYAVTNVSPDMGDATRQALTQFQKDQGLKATGILNEETKKALGMVPVQVAAAAQPATSGEQSASPASTTAPAQENTEPTGEDAIEEEEDGGWSLF